MMFLFGATLSGILVLFVFGVYRRLVIALPADFSLQLAELSGRLHYFLLRQDVKGERCLVISELLKGRLDAHGGARNILRQFYVHEHKSLVESFWQEKRTFRELSRLVSSVEGWEHIEGLLRDKKGAILSRYHYGSIFMMTLALGARGLPLSCHRRSVPVYAGRVWGWIADWHYRVRLRADRNLPTQWIYHQPGKTLEQIIEQINQGHFVIMNAGGGEGSAFVDVPFHGFRMRFSSGLAIVAARSGAPMIPVYCVRQADRTYRIVIEEPIWVPDESPDSLVKAVSRHAQILEKYLLDDPAQWHRLSQLDIVGDKGERTLRVKRRGVHVEIFQNTKNS